MLKNVSGKNYIKANKDVNPEGQTATSAFNYSPIYQKLTKLTWLAPSGGWHYYGPPPDIGTSYGSYWDPINNFGAIVPISSTSMIIYSPATGEEMQYQGPATPDMLYALFNYTGAYEFMPSDKAGNTILTSAPIFSDKVQTQQMFHPLSGADITQEYQAMKANRTAQPAVAVKPAPAPAATAYVQKRKISAQEIDAMSEEALSLALMGMIAEGAEDSGSPAPAAEPPPPPPPPPAKKSEPKSAPPPAQKSPAAPAAETPPAPAPEAPPAEMPSDISAPPPPAAEPAGEMPQMEMPPSAFPEDSGMPSPAAEMPDMESPAASPTESLDMSVPPTSGSPDMGAPSEMESPDMGSPPQSPAGEMPPPEGGGMPAQPSAPPGEAMPSPEGVGVPEEAMPPQGGDMAPESAPSTDFGRMTQPEVPVPQAQIPPAPSETEPKTPTHKLGVAPADQGAMTMSASNQSKEMKAIALKLLSDPDYLKNHEAEVMAAISNAEKVLTAAKSKSEGAGFYNKSEIKEAREKVVNKMDSDGFYPEMIEEARQKTLKEIEKVSSMIDEKILAALEHDTSEGPAAAKWSSMGSKKDPVETAVKDIEAMLEGLDESGITAASKKSKCADCGKSSCECEPKTGHKHHKHHKSAKADVELQSLKNEIAELEASLKEVTAEEFSDADVFSLQGEPEDPLADLKGLTESTHKSSAEAVTHETLVSTGELEAAGPITASAVQMTLFGEGTVNPFWNIVAHGEPVARVHLQDQADPNGDRAFFTSAKYAQGVTQAIEKVGLTDTLTSIGAKMFANRIEKSEVVKTVQAEAEKAIKVTVAQKTASLRDDLVDRMMVAQSALDKNMFKEEGNALKDSLYLQMKKFGIQNPVPYIEAAFEAGATDYFKTILAKAVEFLDMEPKAFEQIKKTVANSDVLSPAAEAADNNIPEAMPTTLAAHLVSNNLPLTVAPHHLATGSYSDLKETFRMGLSLKKTL